MDVCALCVCIARGGQRRVSDPLQLELEMVVNCCVDAGNRLQAGTDPDSYNRQTEVGRHREYGAKNSNLDSLSLLNNSKGN